MTAIVAVLQALAKPQPLILSADSMLLLPYKAG